MARDKNKCPNRVPGPQRTTNNAGRCSCSRSSSSSSTSSLSTGRRRRSSSSSSSDDSATWANFNKRMRSAPEASRSGAGPSGRRRPAVAVQATSPSPSPSQAPPQRRRRRRRPGELVLQEIRRLANTTYPLLPLAPFGRVVHEVMQQVAPPWLGPQLRLQRLALEALREAAEMFCVQLLEDAALCAAHARRITLMPRDVRLVRRLRGVDL